MNTNSTVGILMGCGVAGIAVVLVDIPLLATYMFIILLCSGLAVTVVSAATVELYPTNLRYRVLNCLTKEIRRLKLTNFISSTEQWPCAFR